MLLAGRSLVRDPMRWLNFSIFLIILAALGPGVYSASNRNEYQKQKNNGSGRVERGRRVGLTTLRSSVSRLSRQCGILNISQSYRSPRPVTGIFFTRPLGRSEWPWRGLRREKFPSTQALGSWFRIPLHAWMSVLVSSVSVLLCLAGGLTMGSSSRPRSHRRLRA
jgi:hypothetical protein